MSEQKKFKRKIRTINWEFPVIACLESNGVPGWFLVATESGPAIANSSQISTITPYHQNKELDDVLHDVKCAAIDEYRKWSWEQLKHQFDF